MDDKKNNNLSPEDQLDALLAQFLEEPEDAEVSVLDSPEASQALDPQWLSQLLSEAEPAAATSTEEVQPLENSFLDGLLPAQEEMPEIGTDEQAVADLGLTKPEDVQLEDIIQETKEEWQEEAAPQQDNQEEDEPFLDAETREAFDEGKSLDQVFGPAEVPAPAQKDRADSRIPQKRRPKNKDAYGLFGIPHILSTLIWLVLIAAIGASLGQLIWGWASDVLAFGREDKSVTITITASDDLASITDKLQETGLIEYPSLFKLYAQLTDAMEKMGPGTYELNTLFDYRALVNMMSPTADNRVTIDVRIPEGYNCSQIFQLLQQKGVCTVAELEEAAASGELGDYWFLEDVQRGTANCLEGYLFPDTYTFYVGDNATRVLGKFLANFDVRFTDNMREKLGDLNEMLSAMMAGHGLSQEYIDSHKITIRQIVIIASMIEKETSSVPESYTISSVIYNRLTDPNNYPHLNIDATLVYALGKPQLTEEDKAIDTPYNTYLYPGLIPGPIANPGRSSLDAALDPEITDFHFYAFDPESGKHHFSKNYEEHQAFLDSLKENENG